MKLDMTREWFEKRVELERDVDVGAGPLAFPATAEAGPAAPASTDDSRLALGPLVQLLRRQRGLTVEALAEEAQVDLAQLVNIERDPTFRPAARTIYRIAEVFELPVKPLLRLSGNTRARDPQFRREAVRFAARSESVARLSRAEREALLEYVAFLSERG